MSRSRRTGLDHLLTWGAAMGAFACAAVSFTMSLHALALLAERSGITGTLRYGPPIAIDGLMLVAAVLWVARSRRGLSTVIARVVIGVSTTASILANAAASRPGIVDPEVVNAILWGAMPACLFVAWEMIMAIIRTGLDEHADAVAAEERAQGKTTTRIGRRNTAVLASPIPIQVPAPVPAPVAVPAIASDRPTRPAITAPIEGERPAPLAPASMRGALSIVPSVDPADLAAEPALAATGVGVAVTPTDRVRAILTAMEAAGEPVREGEHGRVLAEDPTLRGEWARPDRAISRLIGSWIAARDETAA